MNPTENIQLIPFLRNLADSVESKKLAPQQLQSIGDFFMSYQFQEQAIKDKDNSGFSSQYTHTELIKFLSLGWYVYQVLLREETLPENISEQDQHRFYYKFDL